MSWKKGDEISERMAIVQLYEIGTETKEELAKVFQMHINSNCSCHQIMSSYKKSAANKQ